MHTYMNMGDVYMRMYYTIVQCTRKAGRSFLFVWILVVAGGRYDGLTPRLSRSTFLGR